MSSLHPSPPEKLMADSDKNKASGCGGLVLAGLGLLLLLASLLTGGVSMDASDQALGALGFVGVLVLMTAGSWMLWQSDS